MIGVVIIVHSGSSRTMYPTRKIGIEFVESVMRGDQKQISQPMDASADLFSERCVGNRSGHSLCVHNQST